MVTVLGESDMDKSAAEVLASMPIGRAALIGLVLADALGLGALAIFVCWPQLFMSLDFSKLLLLSVAVTLPVVALGALVYQTGAVARDYSRLHESLAQNIPFVLLNHLLYVLASFVVVGLQTRLPVAGTWTPSQAFWTFSTLCVLSLFFAGLYLEHQKRWLRVALPVGLVSFAVVRGGYALGKALHFWS